MTRFIQEGPMWRRTLAATLLIVGFSTVFLVAVLIVAGSLVDLAVAPVDRNIETTTSSDETKDSPKVGKKPGETTPVGEQS